MLTQCPNCKQNYEIDDEFNGKFVECSSCKHEFFVVSAMPQKEMPKEQQNTDKQVKNKDCDQHIFKCEYCGGNNFRKENKMIICNSCNTGFQNSKTSNEEKNYEKYKVCGYCKEKINIQASKCKHCGTFLPNAIMRPPCKHFIYVFLAIFFGTFGIHNFYAKRWMEGICQAVITIIAILLQAKSPLVGIIIFLCIYISIIVSICTVYKDGDDVPFS